MLKPRQEHGQSLVLVALMAIVLVAFVGLAIDGGNAYNQRRIAQNAADGAAVRGAQRIADNDWRQGSVDFRRVDLLQRINRIVELHGVPDTNEFPGDENNGNVTAFYTDANGNADRTCDVATCTSLPDDVFGVEVLINKPFDTYFTGIIGWNEMTVGARAVGLARIGRAGYGGDAWAVYAFDNNSCNGAYGSGYEVDIGSATNRVRGNSHSNGSYKIQDAQSELPDTTEITYVVNKVIPIDYLNTRISRDGLALPNFQSYFTLGQTNSQQSGGTYIPNPPIPPGYTRPTHIVTAGPAPGGVLGNATTPYTFINGDLVLTGNHSLGARLGGLIIVNGNVLINATSVATISGGASLLATGSIQITAANNSMTLRPFQDIFVPRRFDPLLDRDIWKTVLWSNADMETVSADPCQVPVIQDFGAGGAINGAILAPNGMVDVSGMGASRIYNGTIIADMVWARGADRKLYFSAIWFPPQPDFVELME